MSESSLTKKQQVFLAMSSAAVNMQTLVVQQGSAAREDAITDYVLMTGATQAKELGAPLVFMSMQNSGKLEKEFGADFYFVDTENKMRFLVQAKRLDFASSNPSYDIDVAQLVKLVNVADTMQRQDGMPTVAIYMFFNVFYKQFGNEWGCSTLRAANIITNPTYQAKALQKTFTLSFGDAQELGMIPLCLLTK